MKIEWEQRVRVAESAPLSLVAACCQAAEGVALPLAAHVVVTDDAEIRALNARTRGVDRATDVLSFPTVNYPAGKTARGCEKRLRAEYDPELGACLLGDIVISYPRALEQAAEYGHSARRELCYLLAHGLFHLMGYDHMDPDEQKEMRAMEEKALGMAGIGARRGPGICDGRGAFGPGPPGHGKRLLPLQPLRRGRGAAQRRRPGVSGLQHRKRQLRADQLRRAHRAVQGRERGRAGLHRHRHRVKRLRALPLRRMPPGARTSSRRGCGCWSPGARARWTKPLCPPCFPTASGPGTCRTDTRGGARWAKPLCPPCFPTASGPGTCRTDTRGEGRGAARGRPARPLLPHGFGPNGPARTDTQGEGEVDETTLPALLPHGFGPKDLPD